ncbi:MAG: hypothetical protein JF597_20080 [Streptomyces sp.]|uniref:hypothetical protein n=1 Tax=Streptomyces sp. TaxID=1931 RepID=UPI0025CED0E2|nr:hypothetical protein [Streptomyces sp.]MBW8795799.1 hypothetical protein [Streptomyces sp.]
MLDRARPGPEPWQRPLLALLLALPGTAVAAPGDLDTAFAGDGTVLTDFGGDDSAADVAVQSDGRIVAAGQGGPD